MFPGRRCVLDLPIPGKGVIYEMVYIFLTNDSDGYTELIRSG